jgi:hypothetical protein
LEKAITEFDPEYEKKVAYLVKNWVDGRQRPLNKSAVSFARKRGLIFPLII